MRSGYSNKAKKQHNSKRTKLLKRFCDGIVYREGYWGPNREFRTEMLRKMFNAPEI